MTQPPENAELAVMVCPQCEGEGGYADGLDEDACHEDCPRCATNGWIVDLDRLASLSSPVLPGVREALEPFANIDILAFDFPDWRSFKIVSADGTTAVLGHVTFGDFRRVRKALALLPSETPNHG